MKGHGILYKKTKRYFLTNIFSFLFICRFFYVLLLKLPHTLMPTYDLACTNTHTSRRAPTVSTSRIASITTQTQDLIDDDRHTYKHPCPRLIACTSIHSSFRLTGAFPLRIRSITRNLRNCFTSVRSLLSKRRSYCRRYCETSGRGALVF